MKIKKSKVVLLIIILTYFPFLLYAIDVGLTKIEGPVIFGKTSYVTGYGFNKDTDLRLVRIDDNPVSFPVEKPNYDQLLKREGEYVAVLQQYENILTIELPAIKNGMGIVFVNEARNIKKSLVINRPELQWLSTDEAYYGDTVRAIGKGLVDISLYPEKDEMGHPVSYANYISAKTKVALKDAKGTFHWCKVEKTSSYDVHFYIPENIALGAAKVYVHAGFGGDYGWSEYQGIEIKEKHKWPEKIFNVKDYGAVGDSFQDDTKSVSSAINDIRKNKGGVLYFPAGGYHLNKTFRLPPNTIIRGESRERSWIFLPDGFHANALDNSVKIVFAGEGSVGMENISIHAVYVNTILMAPVGDSIPNTWLEFSWDEFNQTPGADYSFVNNCRFLHNYTHLYHRRTDDPRENFFERDNSTNVLLRGNNIKISNSEFQGRQNNVYLCDSRYSIINNNIMHSGNAGNNIGLQHGIKGYEKIIIEDNELDGIVPTHHGSVWMMHGGKNLYLHRNVVKRQFWVSDNEGLLGHMWGYRAPLFIKTAYDNRIEIDIDQWEAYWKKMKESGDSSLQKYYPYNRKNVDINDFSIYKGKEIQVFRGKGLGQVNEIAKVEDNVLYFKEPFKTNLSKESMVVLHDAPAFRHLTFAANKLEDTGPAIFLWGHSHEIVIDGNSTVRTGPIGGWTVFHSFSVAGGCHFFQIINNYCSEGRGYVPGQHSPGGRYAAGGIGAQYSCENKWASGGGALSYVGYIIRNNFLENDCSFSFPGYDQTWCSELLDKSEEQKINPYDFVGMIFENNTNKDCSYGMYFGNGMKAVLKNNQFINVDKPVIGAENEGIQNLDEINEDCK